MLPDLSPHLHTEECNFLINLYKDCRVETNLLTQIFTTKCSYWYTAIAQCCHQERRLRKLSNPKYGKRLTELRRLPEENYTPALRKLKEAGKLILSDGKREGCSI